MTTNNKNFNKEVDTKGCQMIASLRDAKNWWTENPEAKVFTLEKNMSVSFEPVSATRKSNDISSIQVDDISSIAKLELESIDDKHAVLRCRTAAIKKIDDNNYDIVYNRIKNNERGKLELKHPYNPMNDRYLDIDFDNQVLTITKRFKKKDDLVVQTLDLKKDTYRGYGSKGISQEDFAWIINDLILKHMNAMLFIADDFFEPIIEACKKYKKFNFILEMCEDDIITHEQSPYTLMMRGFLFDETLAKKVLDGQDINNNGKSNGKRYSYTYCINKKDQMQQIASILFFMTNPGIESIFKSIYKPTLIENLRQGKVFLSSKLAEANDTSKTGLKAMNETCTRLTDPSSLMSQGTIQLESEVGQSMIKYVSNNSETINNALKAFNGYNNYISFLDYYFADYWYYQFLIKSSEKYGIASTRYVRFYGWSEEQIFVTKMDDMCRSFFDDLRSLIQLMEEPGAPTYVNNIENFFDFFINGCRKQGFTSVTSMCSLMKDYISMQQSMGARVEKYPSDIYMAHNIANVNTAIYSTKEEFNSKSFIEAVSSYANLSYSNKEFTIMTPEYFTDLFVEGASLNHCVANYISKVNNKECKILFLRKKDDVTTPYYTICIEGKNKITQVKGLNQKDPDKAELTDFIYEWAGKKNLVPRYL